MFYSSIMPNLKTTEKVLEFVKQQEKAITPTTIHKQTGIAYGSIISSIQKLKEWDQLDTISDGRIILIRFKGGCKNE